MGIEKSIHHSLTNLSYIKFIPPSADPAPLLVAAQELSNAVKNLSRVCESALNTSTTLSARDQLIELFTQVKETLLSKTDHGFSYQRGINKIRLEIVNNLVHLLKNHQNLPEDEVNMRLNELMKDKEIAATLNYKLLALKELLSNSAQPTKRV